MITYRRREMRMIAYCRKHLLRLGAKTTTSKPLKPSALSNCYFAGISTANSPIEKSATCGLSVRRFRRNCRAPRVQPDGGLRLQRLCGECRRPMPRNRIRNIGPTPIAAYDEPVGRDKQRFLDAVLANWAHQIGHVVERDRAVDVLARVALEHTMPLTISRGMYRKAFVKSLRSSTARFLRASRRPWCSSALTAGFFMPTEWRQKLPVMHAKNCSGRLVMSFSFRKDTRPSRTVPLCIRSWERPNVLKSR